MEMGQPQQVYTYESSSHGDGKAHQSKSLSPVCLKEAPFWRDAAVRLRATSKDFSRLLVFVV